jgi:hypothetical protein
MNVQLLETITQSDEIRFRESEQVMGRDLALAADCKDNLRWSQRLEDPDPIP